MDEGNRRDNRKALAHSARKLLSFVMVFFMFVTVAALPESVYAASGKKAKVTYSVSVKNLNTNLVIKKGKTFKIKYKATQKKKGKVSSTRVGFRSSNRKIATVSSRGVIKAKKKGTVSITVYCKKKPSKKKTVKIRVGTPVTSIKMSGQNELCKGRSTSFKAAPNKGATNKKVKWKSSNTAVAAVSSSGKVTARSAGKAVIYASAADGSGVRGSRTVYVHEYKASDAGWIAHRGLHTAAMENSERAFIAAGRNKFWGCECDIWETKHPDMKLPALPDGDVVSAKLEEPDTRHSIEELKEAIEGFRDVGSDGIFDEDDKVREAWAIYEELTAGMSDKEMSDLRAALITGEGETQTDLLEKLFKAYEYVSFDIVINHDQSYNRLFGVDEKVWDMTADDVREDLPEICFLDSFISICNAYGMTPVVEIKGTQGHYISDEAVRKTAEIIFKEGGADLLEKTYFISFDADSLDRTRAHIAEQYGVEPYTAFLISSNWEKNVDLAADKKFTAVSVSKALFSDALYDIAKSRGLGIGTWTYKNSMSDEALLHQHLKSRYDLDFVTLDYRVFR